MANERTYRVLALTGSSSPDEDLSDVYRDLGAHLGHDAKAAIEAALSCHGLPEGTNVCVGIPDGNFNEHDVEPDPRPQFKVTPRKNEEVPPPPLDPGKATN